MKTKYISNQTLPYHTWKMQQSSLPNLSEALELIGAFFNSYQQIYLLFYSKLNNKLYSADYDLLENRLSDFIALMVLPEEVYSASVYSETEASTHWYLLGKKTIWKVSINKPDFSSARLENFPNAIYPLTATSDEGDHKGGTLVVFDKLPWVCGGETYINAWGKKQDNGKRLLLAGRWLENANNRSGVLSEGTSVVNFFNQSRIAPIVHFHNGKIFCIGGNAANNENIVEFSNVRPNYISRNNKRKDNSDEKTDTFTSERSILNYKNLNGNINTSSPRPASCMLENKIFIFSDQLFNKENSIYYQYDVASGRSSDSGNTDWQFLSPKAIQLEDLLFTSAKAVSIGKVIYLILLNKNYQHQVSSEFGAVNKQLSIGEKNRITIFEICLI